MLPAPSLAVRCPRDVRAAAKTTKWAKRRGKTKERPSEKGRPKPLRSPRHGEGGESWDESSSEPSSSAAAAVAAAAALVEEADKRGYIEETEQEEGTEGRAEDEFPSSSSSSSATVDASPPPGLARPWHPGGHEQGSPAGGSAGPLFGCGREKKIVLVRHGVSTWNELGRIQGSTNESELTELGLKQALLCRDALSLIPFDSCFASPLMRARQTTQIIWEGREGEVRFMDELKEMHLYRLEGLTRDEAVAGEHREAFETWRNNPVAFQMHERYPVVELWARAHAVWGEIMRAEGDLHLVVTHKSLLRAMVCVSLNLGPAAFRSMDLHNGGVAVFNVSAKGEPMLSKLNATSHLDLEGVRY
mmetsp:Transcript_7381/g.24493  ORF Transcript_7381/g.24493 Transcript_7381/m.24493 type:complete len:360 (-) Transcript_7381:636-1715(-)